MQLYISDASGEGKKLSIIKLFKKIDEKIHDGIVNYGNVVAISKSSVATWGKAPYDQALETDGGGWCTQFYY